MSDAVPLDLSPEHFGALLAEIGRRLEEHLRSLKDQPAQSTEGFDALRRLLKTPPPESPRSVQETLDLLFERIIPCSLNTAGPGYFAYVPGGGLPTAALAEFIAAVTNRYVGVFAAGPGPALVEVQVVRWLSELMGLPTGSMGVLTTGGSMSNLIAAVTGRETHVPNELHLATAYISSETHHAMAKALRVVGVAPDRIRVVPVRSDFTINLEALTEAITADRRTGARPFFLCGSAGTVNTGAIDPLAELATIAERESLWFHVDGAYGGAFHMLPELRVRFLGMERADSIAIDPHKGFFLPYGTGALLLRDITALRRAHEVQAAYLPDQGTDEDQIDFSALSPELSRDWRGLRLWLPFQLHGIAAFREALRAKYHLAQKAALSLEQCPEVELAHRPPLSLFAFRRRFRDRSVAEENQLNRELLQRINSSRRVMLTGTTIDQHFWLRICVLHFRTDQARMDEALAIIHSELAAS